MLTELRQWEIPVIPLNIVKTDRLFRRGLSSFVQEYQSRPHTPELIDNIWQGFWDKVGDINGFTYNVPRCNLSSEKIAKIERGGRAIVLLPDDIFTRDGIERLIEVFPIRMTWTDDQKEARKIFHSSKKGGCVNVETQLTSPYTIPGGYIEPELKKVIEFDGRNGQRFPTYLVASKFSQYTMGHPFDEHNTFSRIPGSTFKNEALAVTFNDGCFEVIECSREKQSSNLGGRSEEVCEKNINF